MWWVISDALWFVRSSPDTSNFGELPPMRRSAVFGKNGGRRHSGIGGDILKARQHIGGRREQFCRLASASEVCAQQVEHGGVGAIHHREIEETGLDAELLANAASVGRKIGADEVEAQGKSSRARGKNLTRNLLSGRCLGDVVRDELAEELKKLVQFGGAWQIDINPVDLRLRQDRVADVSGGGTDLHLREAVRVTVGGHPHIDVRRAPVGVREVVPDAGGIARLEAPEEKMPAVMCSSVRNEREAQTWSDKRGTLNASELYGPMIVRLGEEAISRFGGYPSP